MGGAPFAPQSPEDPSNTFSRFPRPHPAAEVISMQAVIGENDVIVVGCHRCSATGV